MDVAFPWLHLELTCVTLTSKNAVTQRDQKPLLLLLSLLSTFRGIVPSDKWPAKEDGGNVKCSSSRKNVTSNS